MAAQQGRRISELVEADAVATDDLVALVDVSEAGVVHPDFPGRGPAGTTKFATVEQIVDLASGGVTSVDGQTGAITLDGKVSGSPDGLKITVGSDPPLNPSVGDLWYRPGPGTGLADLGAIIIRSAADFTPYQTGSVITLPAGRLVVMNGTINIGSAHIVLSAGTVLRGYASATLISSATGGVVRCSALAAPVILREFVIVASGGECLNVSGPIDQQLNVFFLGLYGAKAAVVNGFDVPAFKSCAINAADGITFTGTTNKFFVSDTPFFGITGSAIRMATSLVAETADIDTSFFKFDAPGIAIEAEAGYTVSEGNVRGNLTSGTLVRLSGLSSTDLNWTMTDNSGIADSNAVGTMYLTGEPTVTITAVNTPTVVSGTWTAGAFVERFEVVGNTLVYRGNRPASVMITSTFVADPAANNVLLAFRLAVNGTTMAESETLLRVSGGGDVRGGSCSMAAVLEFGDAISLVVENRTDGSNVQILAANIAANR